jgi:membrane protease YdiL (CAAX protease family)
MPARRLPGQLLLPDFYSGRPFSDRFQALQELPPSDLSAPASAGETAGSIQGPGRSPSPWVYIAVIGPLYFLVGGVVQEIQLPLGLLWNQALLFVWPSLLWLWKAGFRPLAFTRSNRPPQRPWLVLGVALTAFVCASAMMGVFETLAPPDWVKMFDETQVLSSVSRRWNVVLFAGVIVGAPLAEELVFRGCLLPMLAERMRVGWAVVIQAALFSFIHGDPIGFFPRFVLGVAFGLLWIYSGSLWAGIFAHALNNGVSALVFFWLGPETGDFAIGDLWLGVAIVVGAGAILSLFLWLLRRMTRPPPLPSSDLEAFGRTVGRVPLFNALRIYAAVGLVSLGFVVLAGHLLQ